MAVKTYIVNDDWKDLDKHNKLAMASEDGEVAGVWLNGEELGGGGGGGDFSTAEITLVCDGFDNDEGTGKIDGCFINNNRIDWFVNIETAATGTLGTFPAVLYKGVGTAFAYPGALVSISGDIVADENGNLTITGNGTIHYLTFEP